MADALGFPDAADTGVSAGVTLKPYNGDLVINTPGAVISGLDIHGTVTINASNVTLVNCHITAPAGAWTVVNVSSGCTGVVIQNCDIDGSAGLSGAKGINMGGSGTLIGNNIHQTEDGIYVLASNVLIQNNYIHNLASTYSDPHYDGIAIDGRGVSNITISHNTIINQYSQTSAVMIDNYFGPVSNIIVDNNRLGGGAYTVFVDGQFGGGSITGVQITNNYISRGDFGYITYNHNTPAYYGNVDVVSGQLIPDQQAVNTSPAITSFSTDSNVVGDGITNDNTLTLSGTAAANSTVKIFDGATQTGSVTANASGSWSYTTATLADGKHSLTATSTSGTSSPLAVTVDTAAPSAPIIISNATVNTNKVTLTGTAEANSTVKVFDGATQIGTSTANGSGAWSYTSAALITGAHSFSAKAMDAAGNTGSASAPVSATIGAAQTPGAPTVNSFSTDSGIVGDHITNDNTLTLTGNAAANSTVKVYDSAALLGTVTANSSGVWSYTTASLKDGIHSLTATATDSVGNTSVASAALAVTVDTVAPASPVFVGDKITSADQVTLNGTAEANSTVKVFEGATVLGTTTTDSTGAWSFTTAPLPAGAHEFTATASDAAGNTSGLSQPLDPVIGSSSAWPDATNTGLPAGVTLLPSGGMIINTAGAVISGLDIHGTVYINAPNVTLMNCRITSSDFYVVKVNAGITGAVVEDCVIDGTGTATQGSQGIAGQGTFLRNNIYNVEHGIQVLGSNTLIQDNYIHDLKAVSSLAAGFSVPHYDGITVDGDISNVTIRHNTVINPYGQTAAVMIDNYYGPVSNIIVDNNKLSGGGYTLYSDGEFTGGTISGVSFTNNQLGMGQWGYTYFVNNTPAWQGNVDIATNQVVTASGTISMGAAEITSFSSDSGIPGDGITNDSTLTLTGTAPVFSTVNVYDAGKLIGTATANATNNWNFTTAALANGSHSLTVTATSGGTTTPPSATLNLTVDTIAPNAPSIFSNTVNSGKVTLNGTAEANSNVQVFEGSTQLGTATANSSGAWSFTTATLTTGTHNFTAKAMDAAGNASGASAATNVTIGSSTPAAPGAPAIASFSNDSGVVGDHVTNDNTLTLTGTAQANSTVKVYDGATLLGSVVANGSGAWSYTTSALGDGPHNLSATASDAAGNTSAASAALSVTIDTKAPAAPVIGSNSVSPTNIVTLNGTAEANSTVTLFDGTTKLGTATANASGAWSFATAALPAGNHSFIATDADAAGNTGAASSNLNLTLATPVPVNLLADTTAWSNLAFPTQTASFTASFDAAPTKLGADIVIGLGAANAAAYTDLAAIVRFNDTNSIDVRNGSGYGADVSVPYTAGTNYHFRMVVNPSAHTYSVYVTPQGGSEIALATNYAFRTEQATDTSLSDVGAFSTSGSATVLNFSIVSALPGAPTITSFSPDTGIVGDGITDPAILTLTGSAVANSTVKVYDGATLLGTATANASGAWSFVTAALPDGLHKFTATDTVSGSTSAASSALNVTIDTAAPLAPSIASFSSDSGVVGDRITNDNTLTLTGTAEANATVKVYDGATLLGSATANGSGAWSYTTAALTNGAHSLTATASDAAANTGAASAALSVTIDTAAPSAPIIVSSTTSSNKVTLNGTAEANSSVQVFEGPTQLGTATTNSGGTWSFTTAALTIGTHNFTAKAMDAAGNNSGASAGTSVTIGTTTQAPGAPTISSFSPDTGVVGDGITDPATLMLTGSAVANSTVNVYDGAKLLGTTTANASGAWNFTTVPLPDGMHSFTATDTVSGSTSAASAAMKVTIDTVAPLAPTITSFSNDSGTLGDHITNDNTLMLTGAAEANATVTVFDGTKMLGSAVANGSGTWSYSTAALADGAHSFTAKASDAAANISAASSALTVTIDKTAPVAPTIASFSNDSGTPGDHVTNDTTLTLAGTAEANSTVNVYDGATLLGNATANGSGGWSYTTGTLAFGPHSFSATDNDAAGNFSAASSALNVSVEKPPIALNVESYSPVAPTFGFLKGTTDANSMVWLYDGNSGAALGATGAVNGSWMLPVSVVGQSNSVRDFLVKASDQAGNTGSAHFVYGTVGNDTIATSAPTHDLLYGNGGNDTFVFSGNIGKDTIADFNATNDTVQLSHNIFADFAAVLAHATQVGSDVTVTIDPSNSITLHNTALSQLTHNNIHIV